jgi:hypothetical protein
MRRSAKRAGLTLLVMLWIGLVDLPGTPFTDSGLVNSANATPPATHRTVRPAPTRRNVDVNVDVDRRGPGSL